MPTDPIPVAGFSLFSKALHQVVHDLITKLDPINHPCEAEALKYSNVPFHNTLLPINFNFT